MESIFSLIASTWYYKVILAIQCLCVIHILKTRRDFYWIWVVMCIPLMGFLVYFYMNWRGAVALINPSRYIKIPMLDMVHAKRAERDYAMQPNLENKIRFADVLLSRGNFTEALKLYENELTGPLKNNVQMLFSYSKVLFALERYDDIVEILTKAEAVPNNDKIKQRRLMHAIALAKLGKDDEAESYYKLAQGGFLGEEAKARYGMFLEAKNRKDEAEKLFSKILESTNISSWSYRREQRVWIAVAKERIKEMQKPAQ